MLSILLCLKCCEKLVCNNYGCKVQLGKSMSAKGQAKVF